MSLGPLSEQFSILEEDEEFLLAEDSPRWEKETLRRIISLQAQGREFADNKIQLDSRSVLHFLFVDTIRQILRPSNLYFLALSFLQIVPSISNTDGRPTILLPLSIVLVCSISNEFLEWRARNKQDDAENKKVTLKFTPGLGGLMNLDSFAPCE